MSSLGKWGLNESPKTASAGFILPGNRVDILMTHTIKWKKKTKSKKDKAKGRSSKGGQDLAVNETKMTETILQNVEVLAINQTVELVEGNSIPAQTVTLEVTPKQAEQLITARSMGKLSMVLRSLQTPKEGDSPLGYTVDMEVSPFFRQYSAAKKAINKNLAEAKAKAKPEPPKTPTAEPVESKAEKKSTFKVFRGKSAGGGEAKE